MVLPVFPCRDRCCMCCIILWVFMQDWLWTLFCLFCPLEICESVGACWHKGNFLSCFFHFSSAFRLFYSLLFIISADELDHKRVMPASDLSGLPRDRQMPRLCDFTSFLGQGLKRWRSQCLRALHDCQWFGMRTAFKKCSSVCVCLDACVCDWDRDHAQQGWQSHRVLVLVHS